MSKTHKWDDGVPRRITPEMLTAGLDYRELERAQKYEQLPDDHPAKTRVMHCEVCAGLVVFPPVDPDWPDWLKCWLPLKALCRGCADAREEWTLYRPHRYGNSEQRWKGD